MSAYCKKSNFLKDRLIDLLYKKYKIKSIMQYYFLYRYDLLFNNIIMIPCHVHKSNRYF